jgi:hypothetical protein
MPKRSCKMSPLSEKMKVLNLIRKKPYAEVAKNFGKNKCSICGIVNK